MVSLVKSILSIDGDDEDEKIATFVEFASAFVMAYCNIKEIASDMQITLAMVTADLYLKFEGQKKVSMGDVAIEIDRNLEAYKEILKKHRKLG